jgi:hypothetical protein
VYRNLHFQILNKSKIIFKNQLLSDYPELTEIRANRVRVSYNVIPNDKRKFDTMNVVSIVDKFFLDALVEFGCIPDDNYDYVLYDRIYTSIIDKNNDCKQIIINCDFL